MCVHDFKAAHDILSTPGVEDAMKSKLMVHLTTGSPEDAREMNTVINDLDARYLDGAIQVAPEQMGKPDTTILISGSQQGFAGARDILNALGGNIVYLGEDAAAAANMDLATLSYIYGASAGFFQGAALVQEEGLDMGTYSAIVEAMTPSFGAFLRHEGEVILKGDFTISQSPLSISVDATRRIEQAMRSKGLRMELPSFMATLLQQAHEAGYGNEEFAAVVKVLRADAATV
jgi:3-hydroxyisobutyrate dehydrogenase-like beta-hydroxyacid dehydrogenase